MLLSVRYFGVLQTLELAAYDQMVRWQPDTAPDPRLLIVGITEEDIQIQQQVPLADEVVAQLLETLEQYQPRVIGLDLYRDIPHPPGNQKLLQQLQADNLIAIYELGDRASVPPPPGVPEKRLGFNDLLFDADNVLRRSLMYVQSESGANKAYSFALQVSLKYLAQNFQIKPDSFQIGQTRFAVLKANSGGYQMEPTEAAGWQTLLKYRSRQIARRISLTEALNGEFDPSWIRDKVVLIGTTAPSEKDIFLSPYSATQSEFSRISGVEAHAQVVSQILTTVLDGQPSFWFWTQWQEWLWIWGWSLVGGVLAWRSHRSLAIVFFLVVAVGSLWGISFRLFLHSGWVPIAAPTLGLIVTGGCVLADKFFDSLYHDSLTKLPNRNLLTRQLKGVKPTQSVAVIVLELNRFELISNSLGHSVGEQFLKAIAKRLHACVPHQAHLARIEKTEFALWLTNLELTMKVANSLQQEVALPFFVNGQEIYTTISVGVAYSQPQSIIKVDELLQNAHIAMYRAKVLGKMRPEVFVTRMHAQTLGRWQLETDLRQAIKRQEFQLYYQPLVLLDTGQLAGFEALVRWFSPHRGFVLPSEFIPIAEETGLIIPLGQKVLQEACRQMKCWHEQFPQASRLMISVNLSQRQFSQPNLSQQVKQALDDVGLDSRSLKLEITESMMMDDVETAIALLHQLKSLNLKLSIDDFGTGYSSFTSLHRFPVDTLKVDKTFITRIEDGGKYAEIVRTIVTLGHNLGMEIIAEGIETNFQIKVLQELKCKYGQGYFFSKPLPAHAATAFLEKEYAWFL